MWPWHVKRSNTRTASLAHGWHLSQWQCGYYLTHSLSWVKGVKLWWLQTCRHPNCNPKKEEEKSLHFLRRHKETKKSKSWSPHFMWVFSPLISLAQHQTHLETDTRTNKLRKYDKFRKVILVISIWTCNTFTYFEF